MKGVSFALVKGFVAKGVGLLSSFLSCFPPSLLFNLLSSFQNEVQAVSGQALVRPREPGVQFQAGAEEAGLGAWV